MSTPTSAAIVTGVLLNVRDKGQNAETIKKTVTVIHKNFEAGEIETKLAEMAKVLNSIEERVNIREGRKLAGGAPTRGCGNG